MVDRSSTRAAYAYIISVLFAAVGTLVFFQSFFPPKSGFAHQISELSDADDSLKSKTHFRTIVMLIDALRADFIYRNDSEFAFVNSCIKKRIAIPFITRAHPPTVTLPRIKSMITGTIPGFMDVAANFNSQEPFA